MKHLIRAGAVLVVFIAVLLIAREILVPSSFGEKGFYRGDNVAEWASRPIQYASSSECRSCHQKRYDGVIASKHNTVPCEDCHGPAQAHIETGVTLPLSISRDLCEVCHAQITGRRRDFPQVDISQHGEKRVCTVCHDPHDPRTQGGARASIIPHGLDGMSQCLLCHSIGGAGVGETGGTGLPPEHEGRPSSFCLACHENA